MTRTTRWAWAALLALGLSCAVARSGHAQGEIVAIIHERAAAHGVDAGWLSRTLWCESRHDPNAVGDRGQSVGVAQIHNRGLHSLFLERGYTDRLDAYQSIDFTAWAFANGLSRHWTCS